MLKYGLRREMHQSLFRGQEALAEKSPQLGRSDVPLYRVEKMTFQETPSARQVWLRTIPHYSSLNCIKSERTKRSKPNLARPIARVRDIAPRKTACVWLKQQNCVDGGCSIRDESGRVEKVACVEKQPRDRASPDPVPARRKNGKTTTIRIGVHRQISQVLSEQKGKGGHGCCKCTNKND